LEGSSCSTVDSDALSAFLLPGFTSYCSYFKELVSINEIDDRAVKHEIAHFSSTWPLLPLAPTRARRLPRHLSSARISHHGPSVALQKNQARPRRRQRCASPLFSCLVPLFVTRPSPFEDDLTTHRRSGQVGILRTLFFFSPPYAWVSHSNSSSLPRV